MDIEEYLGQFQWSDPDPELKQRILNATQRERPASRWRGWRWSFAAAAASLLLAIGTWAFVSTQRHLPISGPVEILGGRGRIVPVASDARFTILDSDQGKVRLEKGEVLIELESDALRSVHVETPAGTAIAQKTCFYAHCSGTDESLLAVAVLNGKVEMATPHGHLICAAGDVAFAQRGRAPHKHTKHATKHHRGFCPFVSTLGLIYRPDVQAELRLTETQRIQLQRPDTDERREICRFFQGLHGLTPKEWTEKTNEFCAELDRKVTRVLTVEQHKRLLQVAYQQEGYFALLRSELSRDFELSSDQQEKIERQLRSFADTRRALLDRSLPSDVWNREINLAWQSCLRDVGELLTATQKQRWQELIGPAANLPQEF